MLKDYDFAGDGKGRGRVWGREHWAGAGGAGGSQLGRLAFAASLLEPSPFLDIFRSRVRWRSALHSTLRRVRGQEKGMGTEIILVF